MKLGQLLVAAMLSVAPLPAIAIAQDNANTVEAAAASTQKIVQDRAIAALRMYRGGDQAALEWFHPNYTEHDLAIGDGIAGLREYVSSASGVEGLQVHRVFQDGRYVVLHSSDAKIASFDVFAFEGDLIVEHWQNAEALGAPNASGRTMVDGTTEISGRGVADLEANKEILAEVAQIIGEGEPYEGLAELYHEDMIQHASYMGDGFQALLDILGPPPAGVTSESRNHFRLADGDFVFTTSEDRTGGKTTAYFDFFRIENGKIAEHWDTVQEVPARSTWKNNNGKF